MVNLYDAHKQWQNRPIDERFTNIGDLKLAVEKRKNTAVEGVSEVKDVTVISDGTDVAIKYLDRDFYPTNWAFNQLCDIAKAPAHYLRTLNSEIISNNLNYGLRNKTNITKILLNVDNGSKVVRAFTSVDYGRIWDLDLVLAVEKLQASNPAWKNPPAYRIPKPGDAGMLMENAGLYASDRDIFMFMVDEDNKIELDNHGSKRLLSRGFFVWNSEVRSKSFGMTTFLYDYVCGNHIVWNAEQISTYRKIHTKTAPELVFNEMLPVLNAYAQSSMHVDLSPLKKAVEFKIADDKDKTIDFLVNRNFTHSEGIKAFEYAEKDGNDGKYLWNVVQNLTSSAREKGHIEERLDLEKRAGRLLDLV